MDPEMQKAQLEFEERKRILGHDTAPLRDLVLALTSSSGSTRSDAESLFYSIVDCCPNQLTDSLLFLFRNCACSDVRAKVASVLRNLYTRSSAHFLWPHLRYTYRCDLKLLLLKFLDEEESRPVLEQVRGIAVELGSRLLPHDDWPELMFFIFGTMVSSSTRKQESAFLLFYHLAGSIGSASFPPLPTLRSILLYSLAYADEMDVRNAALLAAISLVHSTPSTDREKLQDMLPNMMSVWFEASTGNHQELAKEALIKLTSLVEIEPSYFCSSELVEIMLETAMFDELDEELRDEVVKFVVALAKEPGIANMKFIVFDYYSIQRLYVS